jgi:peroxiredoxin/tetratricopeptide (TPR) repeat protein
MPRPRLLILLAAFAAPLAAQEPHAQVALPHRRATLLDGAGRLHFRITTEVPLAQTYFDQGLALLHLGEVLEAQRSFREVTILDPESPMGFWGLALAAGLEHADSIDFARQALQRIAHADDRERSSVELVAQHLGVEGVGHAMGDAVEHGTEAARIRLQRHLAGLAMLHPEELEMRALILREWAAAGTVSVERAGQIAQWFAAAFGAETTHPALCHLIRCTPGEAIDEDRVRDAWRLCTSAPRSGRAWDAAGQLMLRAGRHEDAALLLDAALRADHAALARTSGAPHDLDGYLATVAARCRSLIALRRTAAAAELAEAALRLPRHPTPRDRSAAAALVELEALGERAARTPSPEVEAGGARGAATGGHGVDLESIGPSRWQPRAAPPLRRPRGGGGGEIALADLDGEPVLVVFFLGFGCVHCVEQLRELAPRTAAFRAAGIRVLAVGTDPVEAVGQALDGDPLPFPVLCDPGAEAFRQWSCWDEFDDVPLHGTFLLDGRHQLLWQDIGAEPFLDLDFLLGEATRR